MNENILILGNGQTKRLDNTSLTVEVECFVGISRSERKFCLSLHYNGSNSFLFVNATRNINLKPKILKYEDILVFRKYFKRLFCR